MTLITYLIDILRRLLPSFSGDLPHVASYTRELPVSLTRMYENALDGEHLPWLHNSSFSSLEITDQGDWGWRANAQLEPASRFNRMELELRLDREKHRWITRTLSGLGKGTEIWTHAIPISDQPSNPQIKVVVDFYIPKLPKFLHATYRKQLLATYAKLYDEDVWMMVTRQNELNRLKAGKTSQNSAPLNLGCADTLGQHLPLEFDFNNHPYQLVKLSERWLVHSRVCPHLLGPLNQVHISDDGTQASVQCPWHGYRFDVETRECTSGARCKLAPPPLVRVDAESNQLWIEAAD